MDNIHITGYKSINDQKIALSNINILIGANGSGKSNFISFFDFLNRLYEQKLNDYIELSGGADKILYRGQKVTDSIFFKIFFKDSINGYKAKIQNGRGQFIFIEEGLLYDGNSWDISSSSKEANVKTHNNGWRAKYVRRHLESYRKYHFHDTSAKSPFTHSMDIENDSHFLYSDGSNLAAFLFHIKTEHLKVYQRIVKVVQSIAPYFSDFYLKANKANKIRLQWTDRYSEITYGPTDLSDGTIRFIALTVLFLQPFPPSTIIIDEPELGLHPSAIAKLAGMIQSASSRNSQVILATQSTDLLSHFTPEDIITVDQVNGESTFQRLSSDSLKNWLEDYTIDDLWKRNIISSGQLNYNAE